MFHKAYYIKQLFGALRKNASAEKFVFKLANTKLSSEGFSSYFTAAPPSLLAYPGEKFV